MKIIAITGGIGGGKSVVAAMLVEKGLEVLDLDDVTREVWKREDVVAEIGEALAGRGFLARPYTGRGVRAVAQGAFKDQQLVNVLETVLQPHILKAMLDWLHEREQAGDKTVFVVVPLLFECGLQHLFDVTVTINTDNETRERRLLLSRPLSAHDINQRFMRQWANWAHSAYADIVIENNQGLDELSGKVEAFLEEILAQGGKNGK